MARIVLVMHKPLGAAFALCAEHVLGPQTGLFVFDVPPDADVAAFSTRLCSELLKSPPPGSLVLCDLYGATPFNIAQCAITQAREQGAHACLVTGANLNMVLKALTDRFIDPDALRDSVCRGALRGIVGADPANPGIAGFD